MMQKKFLNKRKLEKYQKLFIHSLNGIGDILVFETHNRTKNELVKSGLESINTYIDNFFKIKESNLDLFERLILSPELFELSSKDKEEAQLRLLLNSDKYLLLFFAVINQIIRVHETAIEVKNDEVSHYATIILRSVLFNLTKSKDNTLFIEQILKILSKIMYQAISADDPSMYSAAIYWYTGIIFRYDVNDICHFDLSYLDTFNKYYFSTVKVIISKGHHNLFKAIIADFYDGIHIRTYDADKIYEYGHLLLRKDFDKYSKLNGKYGIDKLIAELTNSQNDIDTIEKRNEWLKRFNLLRDIISKNISSEDKRELDDLEIKVKNYVDDQFKYKNILDIVFTVCAFCLFKQRINYIKEFWDYKQPSDTDAHWVGHEIIPDDLNKLVILYLKESLFRREIGFWEGHHGSEIYYKRYFILLLSKLLRNIRENKDGTYNDIANFRLPKLAVFRLSNIESSVDNLISIAQDLQQEKEIYSNLGFNVDEIDDLIVQKVIPFLIKLKEKAKLKIYEIELNRKISVKKVSQFKDSFIKEFYNSAHFRSIFKHYDKYKSKIDQSASNSIKWFGISIIDDKAAFFDDWHVSYTGWGENYGRSLSADEDAALFNRVKELCKVSTIKDVDKVITYFENINDLIILTTFGAIYHYFKDASKYFPSHLLEEEKLPIECFSGYYKTRDVNIPVFTIHTKKKNNALLLIDLNKIGSLIQYNPQFEDDTENYIYDVFRFKIEDFTENQELIDKYLKMKPDWLKKIDNIEDKTDYLKKRVLIEIHERFEYKKDEDFTGYSIS